jgi:hypothetical protein
VFNVLRRCSLAVAAQVLTITVVVQAAVVAVLVAPLLSKSLLPGSRFKL